MAKKDTIELDELIKTTQEFKEDNEYKLSKTKVPAKKRNFKYQINFWRSLNHHLTTLKANRNGKSNRN